MNPFHLSQAERREGCVDLTHGAGGHAMQTLIHALFQRHLANEALSRGDDGAVLTGLTFGERLVLATDAHVVSPLIFPGGDIGALAVHGTINDLAMMGALPLYLTAAFILEEGLPLATLEQIVVSMGQAAREAGVPVVSGDTKVVERGKGDGLFIITTGVGALPAGREVGGARAQPGDAVLVSGTLGDHGAAILSQREGLTFDAPIVSDSAALHGLVEALFASGGEIHVLRDPTRGGVAATLNEIAWQSNVGILIDEAALPVTPAVAAACELLGLEPIHLANEGKLLCLCPANDAEKLLAALRGHPLGRQAAKIGTVTASERPRVELRTAFGARRLVDWLSGEPLPRIC